MPTGITVFCFHAVVAEPLDVPHFCFTECAIFRRQLLAIASEYEVVPLRAAIDRLRSGHTEPDGRTAAITFDDGYQTTHDLVLPLLVELETPATCFINSSPVGTGRPLWFARLHHAISSTTHPSAAWVGRTLPLSSASQRAAAVAVVEADLKELPGDVVDDEVDRFCATLDVNPESARDRAEYRPLDDTSIDAMVRSGLIEFGAHGHRHMILSTVEPETQRDEITTSVDAVRRLTGQPADVFAYPNGQPADYDDVTVAALENAGVVAAFTAVGGVCEPDTSMWDLPRVLVGPSG